MSSSEPTGWAEADWERLTAYVPVEGDEVAARTGLDVAGLDLLTSGKANSNYRVRVHGGDDVVLRIYERDRDAIEREWRIADLVGGTVPVARFLGRGGLENGLPFALIEFIEGAQAHEVMDQSPYSVGRSLGEVLRRLESVDPPEGRQALGLFAADLRLDRTFESVADSFVDLIAWSLREGRARKRLGPELRAGLAAVLDQAARRLEAVDAWRGLVHGDYKPSNLLVREERLVGVLDWEFACAFTPLLDVAILMRHRDDFPAEFARGFEAGHGELPEGWRELSRIIDLMNLVGFLNASGERPKLYDAVKRRIAETIELLV